jgi:hypothetical protein
MAFAADVAHDEVRVLLQEALLWGLSLFFDAGVGDSLQVRITGRKPKLTKPY